MKNKKNKNKINRIIAIISILFIFIFSSNSFASEITVENVINFVNLSREKEGLADLVENEQLMKVAEDKLNDMISNHYFAHTSPTGINPWYWFGKNGYDYQYAGENLAINFLTAETQHEAWMDSPTHRKNIVNSNFKEIGIAVGAGEFEGETAIITVQEFGAKAGAGELPIGSRNFSGEGKNNLIEEGKKIIPQVLSMKDLSLNQTEFEKIPVIENARKESVWEDAFQKAKENRMILIERVEDCATYVLMASLIVSPMAFLIVVFNNIAVSRGWKRRVLEILNLSAKSSKA